MKTKEINKRVNFWRSEQMKHIKKAEKIQGIITNLQEMCPHKYPNGTSAIQDDAFASQYAIPVCQICGKRFEKDNS